MVKLNVQNINQESVKGADIRGRLYSERIFLMRDAGVDSKTFHVWKAKGLLDFVERGKWARFSFIELLWLRVLESMRKFGCSVKLMKRVYDDLFTKAFKENLADINLAAQLTHYTNLSKARPLNYDESEILRQLQYIQKYPILKARLRNEISYFYQLVLDCLKYKTDAGIIIYEDGKFKKFLNNPDGNNADKDIIIDIAKPHIYIPITSYILEFIEDKEKEPFLIKTNLLSEDEYRVIREIRNENVKSITITFKEGGQAIEKIVCDKKGLIKGDDAKKIMKLLGLKNYSGIQLSTRDGSTLSFVHSEKKFF